MNQLTTLLEDASAHVPAEPFELDAIVSTGRSRVRRRRVVAGLATAAVIGLGAALVVPGAGGDGGDNEPTGPTPHVRVLTLDDAVPAEPGRDYQVLGEFTAHSADHALTGDFVRGVLPDGTVVVARYPDGRMSTSEVALVGPGGTQVVPAPAGIGNYLGWVDGNPVFDGNDGLALLDRASQQWRQLPGTGLVDGNATVQPLMSADGHLYVGEAPTAGDDTRPLLDVDARAGTATELAAGGHVAGHDGVVAWTDRYDGAVREVTVREPDGSTTSFDPHSDGCVAHGIGVTADRVVLLTNCRDTAGDYEYTDVITRIDVFDLDGTPLTRIEADGEDQGPVRMSDRYLQLSQWSGDRAGSYTYDLESGRFLRVTDALSGLAGNETGVGSTVVWEERLDGDSGATYVVAQMQ
jgi:hypothetical protein